MVIFAKKRFEFAHKGQVFVVPRINDFVEVPDWVAQSDLYRLALKSGDVRAMEQGSAKKEKPSGRDA